METQKLTKVGGSVMLTIPPRALKQLQPTAGSQVNVAISDGQLVVTPATGSIGIKARLAMCDFSVSPDGDRAGGGAQLGSHARGRGRRNLRSSANVSARCTGCIPRVRGWPSSSLTALPRCRAWPGGALSSGTSLQVSVAVDRLGLAGAGPPLVTLTAATKASMA